VLAHSSRAFKLINNIGLTEVLPTLTTILHNNITGLELFVIYDSFYVGHGVFGNNMCFYYPLYGVFVLFVVWVDLIAVVYGNILLMIFSGVIFSFF